jgi:probable F420-dependent oxidoreductase
MHIGVVYPQTEYGNDPEAIRDYAQTAEDLRFSHVLAYDHVLGANPERPGGWQGVYTYESAFQEPFVLFSFMAAVTKKLGFATGVIILPQRQTALVAKQAASLDVLSGGRLRLGVGIGWNEVEYVALNEDFHNRGRRIEEQVEVLRKLWTQPLVNFSGRWHTIPDAGLNPLPVQRPIPVWFGGHAKPVLQRMARLGDGWMTNHRSAESARPVLDQLQIYLEAEGRSLTQPSEAEGQTPRGDRFGIEARLPYGDGNPNLWEKLIDDWQAAGATHFSLNTMGAGLNSPSEHLAALEKFAIAAGLG